MKLNYKYPTAYTINSLNVLNTALATLPAYKDWRQFDPGPSYSVDARYASLPALNKKDIRAHFPAGFVPPEKDLQQALDSKEIEFVKTSGSIDIAVTNIWYQKWWDASEKSSWQLNAYAQKLATGNHREAILVNPMNVGIISDDKPLSLQERTLSRFLYLNERTSPAFWTEAHMERMAEELNVFQPDVLEANPSLLAKLCRYLAAAGRKVYQPGLIIFTYEYPAVLHLRQIRQVFQSPLASSYGSTETGYVFMQCEAGKFHHNYEACRVDFQPLKKEHGGPAVGRILVTPFNNPWYYLLRFYVGDLVRIDETGVCACGRDHGMLLSAIEGRTFSATLTTSGRLVTLREADNVISAFTEIEEYKIEQTAARHYDVSLVASFQHRNTLNKNVTEALKNLYGSEAEIVIIYREMILPETSGKHCLVKTTFPIDIEDYLEK
ncbi:MAG: hypothetical protein PHE50_07035 [Dehalococcoidales bacterium]|nr:hypothetical protein [Dehalococcoidales bacterium]